MNSRHPDPKRVLEGTEWQVMTPLPGIPRACSKKHVLEEHSFTFADFCWPLIHLPGIPGLPQMLVLEQHSFTFADFRCLLTHLPGIPRIPRACSNKLVLEQLSFTFADFCWPLTHLPGIPGPINHRATFSSTSCTIC